MTFTNFQPLIDRGSDVPASKSAGTLSQRGIAMKANWIPALLAVTLALGFADESAKVEYKPLSIGALQEFGVLKSGRFGGVPSTFKNEWTDHMGAFVTQEVVASERLTIRVGLGGIFEFQKPEKINPNWGGTQYRNFFVGPSTAEAVYSRDLGEGHWSTGIGMFPFKYNPDATNLGEYLFRTGPYPGYIWSGGYSYIGDDCAHLQGLKAHYALGGFSADVLALTETTLPPLYDISLAAIVKYSVAGGLLDLTGGVNLKRLISIHPSKTTRETPTNSYFTRNGKTFTGKQTYYAEQEAFFQAPADKMGLRATELRALGTAEATAQADALIADSTALHAKAAPFKMDKDSVSFWTRPTTPGDTNHNPPAYQYYTQAGIVVMAAASLDLKKIIPADIFGPNDLRLYVETALLGVKDYPIFYEKKSERIPIMVGFNFPGFRFIDLIAVQAEIYKSPWINSYEETGESNEATPYIPGGADPIYSGANYKDITGKDDIYWSVLVRKQLVTGLTATAQVARDHIRSVSEASWAGPGTDPNEIFYSNKNWYWMLQFSFGI